ncbi:EKC/KEOPS complex subunit TPRKB-like [Bombyx mandarina]|uniref:EKC/KEOPS complex subunit TPRKB-like n=1 Tax=Bombyx mandarina TaxID=7092 RepID=A0A6J2JRE1_BOMMA|nr:EKC/KEOPS complex subunit TPRKB-like [Bombyx mandarina]
MKLEHFTCVLDPETKTTLKIYLYKNVQNIEEIRNLVTNGEWNCAIIKPSLILDPFQVAVAANRAVVAAKLSTMVTRTVFGEILYNLSLTKNITQSLSKFGIEKSHDLLVCFLVTNEIDCRPEILPEIKGEQCSITELCNFTNLKDVKSVYKLNNLKSDEGLLDIIVSRMTTKNFVSY